VGSGRSDLRRLGNKRRAGVVVVLTLVGVRCKTTAASFLLLLLLLLVVLVAGGSSSSNRQGMGHRLRRVCIVLRGVLTWSLRVVTVVEEEEGVEEEEEAVHDNGKTNRCPVCLGRLGIRIRCCLVLLLLRWALLH
jgi:hypothetical protein